jgi:hypothetical protein
MGGEAALRTEALLRLSDNDREGVDPAQMAKAVDSPQYAPAVSLPRGVYDDLISTGLYPELGDPRPPGRAQRGTCVCGRAPGLRLRQPPADPDGVRLARLVGGSRLRLEPVQPGMPAQ